jgi:hypothetical protein
MAKNSGSTNYTMLDVKRLFPIVEAVFPLGRDEWERLAVTYNAGRARGSPERDFESLRHKSKVLNSARKLTGMPKMPPHILRDKENKRAIVDKANVIEIDDEADRDQRFVEPDPDTDILDGGGEGSQDAFDAGISTGDSLFTGEFVASGSTESSRSPTSGEFQDLLAAPLDVDGLAARARTPRHAPLLASQHPRLPGSGGPPADKDVLLGARRRARSTRPHPTALGAPI